MYIHECGQCLKHLILKNGVSTLYPPRSIAHIFGSWLNVVDVRCKQLIRVAALAVIWSLWLCRNDKVFNDKKCSFMQVIYGTTATLRSWSQLQRVGASRPVYGGLYKTGGYGERLFISTWMAA